MLVKKHKQPKGGPRSKYPGLPLILGFPSGSAVRNLPAIAGDTGSIGRQIGSGRCPGGGNGNPLQDSSLRNPMDRGAWQAIVHEVAKSQTRLKPLSMHAPELAGKFFTMEPLCSYKN